MYCSLLFTDAASSSRHVDIPAFPSKPRPRITMPPDPFTGPNFEYSSSVPTSNFMPPQFSTHYNDQDILDQRPIKVMDGLNHQRSSSTGYQADKVFMMGNSRLPLGKQQADPYDDYNTSKPRPSARDVEGGMEDFPNKGSRRSSRASSRSSICSLDSDSSAGARSDGERRGRRRSDGERQGSSGTDKMRGYSSGEYRRVASRRKKSRERQKQAPEQHTPSGSGGKSFGSKIVRALSDVGLNSNTKPSGAAKGSTSARERKASRKTSQGSSGRISSGSGGNKSPGANRSCHSSSDGTGRRKNQSPGIFYKDDDPTFIHNSINLHLDMEVFDNKQGEHFKMAFRSPVVKYGEVGDVPVLVIVSNIYAYIFKIIAPER